MSYTPAKRLQNSGLATSNSNSLIELVKRAEKEIKRALPRHINPERMIRILLTEVRLNPKLGDCTPSSFLGAAIQAAQLGLEPGSGLGHCYLIPRWNKHKKSLEVQFMIGYQGMVELAERSGRVTVEAHLIYENDIFDFKLGLHPDITHVPCWGNDPGEITGAYAVARYSDGRFKFRVINKHEIDEARSNSDSGKSDFSPWSSHYGEMARKTAIRRLFKLLPKSVEMARVQTLEDKLEIGESQDLPNFYEEEINKEEKIEIENIESEKKISES